jgi:hypothetical protein
MIKDKQVPSNAKGSGVNRRNILLQGTTPLALSLSVQVDLLHTHSLRLQGASRTS